MMAVSVMHLMQTAHKAVLLQHPAAVHAKGICTLTKVPKIDSHGTEMSDDVMVFVLQCQPGCLGCFRTWQGHGLESPRHAKMDVHNVGCFHIPKKVK